ncbi:hypothetical protein E2C01_060187 [Portunus trituberculatus]|uniref:Uncharacterized protein n=1 Tax=Portunus trituberculatus TaxID=210409 RepID=A0A5B7HBC8_PORTR|nr:hypothetical protein [Portunus trituberculatus]
MPSDVWQLTDLYEGRLCHPDTARHRKPLKPLIKAQGKHSRDQRDEIMFPLLRGPTTCLLYKRSRPRLTPSPLTPQSPTNPRRHGVFSPPNSHTTQQLHLPTSNINNHTSIHI